MSVIPQTPRASVPYKGSVRDPLGTLSGPQNPRIPTPPLTTNPGSASGSYALDFILSAMTFNLDVKEDEEGW